VAVDDEVARILSTCAERPLIPDRTLDPRTTGFLQESVHTTIDAIQSNADIDVSGPQMAKICYSLFPSDNGGSFLGWVEDFFGARFGDLQTVIAYVPMVHSCIPDPFSVAAQRNIEVHRTNPEWVSLVNTLLPDSSAKFTAASSVQFGATDLDPGQWAWVEYIDSVNMTNGVLLESVESTADLEGAAPPRTRAEFEAGNPTTPQDPAAAGDYAAANMKYFGMQKYQSRLKRKAYDMIILHDGGRWSFMGKDKSGGQLKSGPASVASLIGHFNLKKLSSHYFIDGDGTIYQLMAESTAGRHAGAAKPAIKAPNTRSIGIELRNVHISPEKKTITTAGGKKKKKKIPHPEGKSGKYTDAQYDALNLLIEDISARRGIPRDDKHILAHFEVVKGHHNDPLPDFKWLRVNNLQYDHREHNGPRMASLIKSSDTKTT